MNMEDWVSAIQHCNSCLSEIPENNFFTTNKSLLLLLRAKVLSLSLFNLGFAPHILIIGTVSTTKLETSIC